MSKFFRIALTAFAVLCVVAPMTNKALADGRKPASLLIFPIYDSRPGSGTLISVVNTNDDPSFNEETNLNGVIDAHFIYIDGIYWTEFDRFERLTPNDVLSVVTDNHNPNSELGFLYVVALDPSTRAPADLDFLIGDEIVVDADSNWLYALEAIPFEADPQAGGMLPNDDGVLELDGNEYEAVADEMMASFVAQNRNIHSTLILVSLVGSSDFRTDIDFEVFNNNEDEFSTTHAIRCWDKVELKDIDGLFNESFLQTTGPAPATILTGWMRMDGDRAVDVVGNEPREDDPAFVGAIVQSMTTYAAGHLLHESKARNEDAGLLDQP